MLLYHGTSEARWNLIREAGALLPRKQAGQNNWSHTVSSHPNAVYLTECYAGYFALGALRDVDYTDEGEGAKVAILEFDTDKLTGLTWDEDALEQSTREGKVTTKEMRRRTAYARGKMAGAVGTDAWKHSIAALGTCGHIGPISLDALVRVALVPIRKDPFWTISSLDPTITLMNYKVCGETYRELTRQAFEIGTVLESDSVIRLEQ